MNNLTSKEALLKTLDEIRKCGLQNSGNYKTAKQLLDETHSQLLKAPISENEQRLKKVIENIALIAHYGGLVDMDLSDALVSIRIETTPFLNKNETNDSAMKALSAFKKAR